MTVYPTLVFDWLNLDEREIAENVWHAQKAGWPKELTYVLEKDAILRRQEGARKRRIALESPGEAVPRILSRDEYPFACTAEHKGPVWVGHVPASQNSRQGGKVSAFLKQHGAYDGAKNHPLGFRFVVEVINCRVPETP